MKMGACYSKSGHEVNSSYRENRKPHEKRKSKHSVKNGRVKSFYDKEFPNNPGVIQNDLADTVYTEDSHTIHDVLDEDCISRSQQTSLDHLVKDTNKNIETLTSYRKSSNTLCNSDICDVGRNSDSCEVGNSKSTSCNSEHLDTCNGKVIASDSGIVVENSDHLDSLIHCQKDNQETDQNVNVPSRPNTLPLELNLEPVHSCTCSSLELTSSTPNRSQTEHSSSSNGECQGHFLSTGLHMNRSAETLVLKSSLKKNKSNFKKKKSRLSWKSADSLDLPDAMATSMDRVKSLASSIFGFADEMNLNAPLATFDSVDFALGSSYDFSKHARSSNCVEYCSNTFNFKFDFSGLEGDKRRSVTSVERIVETPKGEACADLDKIKLAIRQSSVSTPIEQR